MLTLLLVIVRFISDGVGFGVDLSRGIGNYLGTLATIAIVVGCVLGFKESGGDLNDLKDVNKLKKPFSGMGGGSTPPPPPGMVPPPPPPPERYDASSAAASSPAACRLNGPHLDESTKSPARRGSSTCPGTGPTPGNVSVRCCSAAPDRRPPYGLGRGEVRGW